MIVDMRCCVLLDKQSVSITSVALSCGRDSHRLISHQQCSHNHCSCRTSHTSRPSSVLTLWSDRRLQRRSFSHVFSHRLRCFSCRRRAGEVRLSFTVESDCDVRSIGDDWDSNCRSVCCRAFCWDPHTRAKWQRLLQLKTYLSHCELQFPHCLVILIWFKI